MSYILSNCSFTIITAVCIITLDCCTHYSDHHIVCELVTHLSLQVTQSLSLASQETIVYLVSSVNFIHTLYMHFYVMKNAELYTC